MTLVGLIIALFGIAFIFSNHVVIGIMGLLLALLLLMLDPKT